MRWCKSLFIVSMCAGPAAAAPAFDPPTSAVCLKDRAAATGWRLDRRRLVTQLLDGTVKISVSELLPNGDDYTLEAKLAALASPESFCQVHQCKPAALKLLQRAQAYLIDYIAAKRQVPEGAAGVHIVGSYATGSDVSHVRGTCVVETTTVAASDKNNGTAKPAPAPPDEYVTPSFIALRQNIEDLSISSNDARFKKVARANLAIDTDFVAKKSAFGITGALGYTFGPGAIGDSMATAQFTPFVAYTQNFVDTNRKPTTRIWNLSTGVSGDLFFPFLGMYHDLTFIPKFTTSLRSKTELLSGTIVYRPEPAWPAFGQVYYLVEDTLSMQLTPQVSYTFADVMRRGLDTTFLGIGRFSRLGPKISLALYGEGALKSLSLISSYEIYRMFSGPIRTPFRSQTTLAYTFGASDAYALQLNYVTGNNLDTYQRQQEVTLGFGVKY